MTFSEDIIRKVEDDSLVVGVVGLGYVGLPLATAFARRFKVIGFDTWVERVEMLRRGVSYIDDVKDLGNGKFHPTTDPDRLAECDVIIIAVPTPLHENKRPDLKPVKSASEAVGKILRRGQLVVLESTTYPGTTEEIMLPTLEERSGLKVLKDFGVAYSPERIDPGNRDLQRHHHAQDRRWPNSGMDGCHGQSTGRSSPTFKVSDCKTAEMVKIYENVFRNVNIALVNEMALICERMGIDMWEVIEAAKTKPYGFMAFYPGPGVGGHCIPLDPYYLAYRSRQFDYIPQFIETSGEVNDYMPVHVVNLAKKGLERVGKRIHEANIAVLGIAYKENVTDTRESPAVPIIEELIDRGSTVKVYDPLAQSIKIDGATLESERSVEEVLAWADCAILLTAHSKLREQLRAVMPTISRTDFVFVDTRNVIRDKVNGFRGVVVKLGSTKEK